MTDSQRLVDAIRNHMRAHGLSMAEMAKRAKVATSTLSRWLSGKSEPRISNYDDILGALPLTVRKDLTSQISLPGHTEALQPTSQANNRQESLANQLGDASTTYSVKSLTPLSGIRLTRVPVISLAKAAGWNPEAHHDFSNYCDDINGDYEEWEPLPDGHHLFRIEGQSGQPLMPPGTVVQVNMNVYPSSGQIVVAKISANEFPVLKMYFRKANVISLESINDDPDEGTDYLIDVKNPHADRIEWMRPVVKYASPPPKRRSRHLS